MKYVAIVIIMPYTRVVLNLKSPDTKTELKKIIAEFKNSDEAIKALIEMYHVQKPKTTFV